MSTRESIVNILKQIKPTIDLENKSNIIDGGYLDSLELMTLISALMETFCIELDVDWTTPENFNSINAIASLIDRIKG